MRRIGIDVGGTNTDAVLIEDESVLAGVKTATTDDITGGILNALRELLATVDGGPGRIDAAMIGTTHFTNAVVQRRGLTSVAAVRIGLPASASLPPFVDWPDDLAAVVRGRVFMIEGGHEYDGRPLVEFDAAAMRAAAREIAVSGITSVGVASIFSPLTSECEEAAAVIIREECPGVDITLSHELGRIGLLERENATLLNASIIDLARRTTHAFTEALRQSGIDAPLYLTQNDGTVMLADFARKYPIYSFASGPTNSMRGAAFLTGLDDAIVVDVGGTTTDVGVLTAGFPREANNVVEIGGVRTLFRMPDLLSLGLGGGSIVGPHGNPEGSPNGGSDRVSVGPVSVGHRITEEALVFGGNTLTATDIAVAAGMVELGQPGMVASLDPAMVKACSQRIRTMIDEAVDRMKVDATPVPLIAVGGGAFLVPEDLPGVSTVIHVEHSGVANAVGAAIAQVSGEVDQVFSEVGRDAAIATATELARQRTIDAGADPATLSVVEVEDLPLSYVPGDSRRVRVRIVGDTAAV
ncbi:MAG: hydantoinase/oxoprolinase family protein [Chloroflexi bacterium]|nr:hydantoinase/oxoprolinase family protein [Chloroflexota bacterium]